MSRRQLEMKGRRPPGAVLHSSNEPRPGNSAQLNQSICTFGERSLERNSPRKHHRRTVKDTGHFAADRDRVLCFETGGKDALRIDVQTEMPPTAVEGYLGLWRRQAGKCHWCGSTGC